MKESITRLVILGAGRPHRGQQHSVLRGASGRSRVLDWLLQAASWTRPEVHFVGGYQLEEISRQYPGLHYTVNPDWRTTGAAMSLLQAPLNETDTHLISYADVLFRESIVRRLAMDESDIAVAVDSHWRNRYSGRSEEDLARCEKVNLHGNRITRLGRDILPALADAEFIGLVRLSPAVAGYLASEGSKLPAEVRGGNLVGLLELLRVRGFSVTGVDVQGDWAELNAPQDLSRFILGTKAQTLGRLQGVLKNSRIEDQVSFTVEQWRSQAADLVDRIGNAFAVPSLVVRSSALTEDGFASSNAGAYTSVLNVNARSSKSVMEAVEQVIDSYPDEDPHNQVLVQPMVEGVQASGVAFTRTLAHGAPYYVINYDDISQSTESITSGTSREHKTLLVYRYGSIEGAALPEPMRGLLPALREIEDLLDFESLDVEFAIGRGGQVHILQVRPLAVEHEPADREVTDELLLAAKRRFQDLQPPAPFVVGSQATFGIMPDWNPAEIIGTRPGRLATSLYRYLIMDEVWATQRAEYGYRDVRPQPLLTAFAGHPYVDVRASFNSFIPASVDDALAGRLVDFYLDWLRARPHLHDKVEFDVVPTCYGLDFDRWRQRLLEGGFDSSEVDRLRSGLKDITRGALKRTGDDLARVDLLDERYAAITAGSYPPLDRALLLLEDCRRHGTLVFAHLARSAFVAVTLLRSAVEAGVISDEAKDAFMGSVETVTHRFTRDAAATAAGDMEWSAFVSRYGHLRPGTYDITSLSYADDPDRFLAPVVEKATSTGDLPDPAPWRRAYPDFVAALEREGLADAGENVEQFLRQAIEGREYAKFVFTRHLSKALDLLAEYGQTQDLSREQLAHIPLAALFGLRSGAYSGTREDQWLRGLAEEGAEAHRHAAQVELPPLLMKEQDFQAFLYPGNQANYVGASRVVAPCLDLETDAAAVEGALDGKIAMIPQADPGYDWLFGQGIAGLVTMYGGANSHMAIRAAEFGLPAAIGVGEAKYASLRVASVLALDPHNRRVEVIR